jgi:penicillin-binding protein 1A
MNMNYGKRGVRQKQRALNSLWTKLGKMFFLAIVKAFLVALVCVGTIGICMGIGMFRGILASAPDTSNLDVTPSGYATVVYNAKGQQISKLVAENSNRSYVNISLIPQHLSDAFVAIEDERFYEHNGIDIKGIVRAGVSTIKNRGLGQGASTITQQLLKNNVFEGWATETSNMAKIKRKIQEQYLAIELEKKMSKSDILELYMNSINLGQNTLGVQAASMRYFNKPVSELKLSECAVIAGITQNPSRYNPISHPDKNAERREKVLNKMLEQGYITQKEYDAAMVDDVYSRIQLVNQETSATSVNSYFVDALIEQMIDDLMEQKGYNETQAYNMVYSGGLTVQTTQDPDIQRICDTVFNDESNYPANTKWSLSYELTVSNKATGEYKNYSTEMFRDYFRQENGSYTTLYSSQDAAYADIETFKQAVTTNGMTVYAEKATLTPQPQVCITVEDHNTGYIVAMVGGRGPKSASRTFNRATDSPRQPGSTFKVLSTYAPALDSAGLTLATVETDAPYNYENGRPVSNWYHNGYKGICSLRYGIEQSLNIVTVKTLTRITPRLGFDYLQKFGFTTLVERQEIPNANGGVSVFTDIQQALALGGITKGVTNKELNAAYATIANGGTYIRPTLYTKILDHDGNILIDNTEPDSSQVLKPTTAFLLTDAMVDVVTKGTGTAVNFGDMAIAGKTGTTSDYNDVWFAGYTPYYTATTWAGFDNNQFTAKLESPDEKALAKTLWRAVMSQIHEGLPNKSFEKPEGIVSATICSQSGLLPKQGLCDGCLNTEYFAEGTVPTQTCNVHISNMVCSATGLAAVEGCPYAVPGVITATPADDGSQGSISYCPHTPAFLSNPANAEAAQQAALQAAQAAQQAAMEAAQKAQQEAIEAAQRAAQAAQEQATVGQ